jgi:hypothetical protein
MPLPAKLVPANQTSAERIRMLRNMLFSMAVLSLSTVFLCSIRLYKLNHWTAFFPEVAKFMLIGVAVRYAWPSSADNRNEDTKIAVLILGNLAVIMSMLGDLGSGNIL